ncbi:MAG: hypothetical protein J6Y77_03800 [Paludibacteraceae bacterium]|nr:hypothetical protein [Paludibacteraceae bacterium]
MRIGIQDKSGIISQLLFWALLLTGAIVFGYQLAYTLRTAPVYCDSGYYLAIARQMVDGHRLYSDIHCAYPPLWLYTASVIFRLFPGMDYSGWLLLQAAVNLLTGLFAGLVTYKFGQSRIFAVIAGWLFVCSSYNFGGDSVLLEVPSLLLGLVSAWLILSHPRGLCAAFFAGLLAAAAMGVKQYGGGFILLNVGLLLYTRERFWKRLALYLAGAAILWAALLSLNPDMLMIFRSGYGTSQTAEALYSDRPLLRHIPEALRLLLHDFLPALVLLLWIPLYKQRHQAYALLWCLGGLVGFLGQFYFNNGDHYYLYLMGMGSVAIGCMGAFFCHRSFWLSAIYCLLLCKTVNCQAVHYQTCSWYRNGDKAFAGRITENILSHTQPDSRLYVFNAEDFGQYYLTRLQPPRINGKLSYSFGPLVLTDSLVSQRIRHSDYILKRTNLEWEFKVCDSLNTLLSQCDTLYRDSTAVLLAPVR